MVADDLVVGMEEPAASDGRLTGGKGANLAKLYNILGKDNVPYAIMVTTEFSKILLNDKNVVELIKKLDDALSKDDEKEDRKIANQISNYIENIKTQPKLLEILSKKIEVMKKRVGRNRVAVRSSGITEDMGFAVARIV